MAYRLPAHLHRNRHGGLYFRLSVPNDIRHLLGQREIYRSLGTSSVRQAADAAQALRIAFGAIFRQLRGLIMSEPEKAAQTALEAFAQVPDLRLRLKNAGLQIALEEQRRQLDLRESEIVNQKAQHERDLEIVIKTTGGSLAPATIPDTPTITDVWERYKAEKIALGISGSKGGWKDGEDTAKYDHWPHIRAFIEKTGNKQIGRVTADEIAQFRAFILSNNPTESPTNKQKRLSRVGALFRWAHDTQRIIPDSFSGLFKIPINSGKNNYQQFSLEDLKALFESESYRNNLFKYPSEYWIPTISLFTGCRLNEIAQLTVSDISELDGVKVLSVLYEDNKRLKNDASRRIIPIHSKLIDLGFLDYVNTHRAIDSVGRLFPELQESKQKSGDYSKEPSRRFTAYRRIMNVGDDKLNPLTGKWEGKSRKAFHSFRSTFIVALRKADVPKERRTRLAGHEFSDTQDSNYDGGDALTMFPFLTLKADIDRATFDVKFTPYTPKSNSKCP
jgi:integrase